MTAYYALLKSLGGGPLLGDYDFAKTQTLDPRVSFTRASTRSRGNPTGLVETIASGAPGFDFDPLTLSPQGLLIEPQRTNLFTYSETFATGWNAIGSPAATTTNTAPDGTATATSFVGGSGDLGYYLNQPVTANFYVFSAFVKNISGTSVAHIGSPTATWAVNGSSPASIQFTPSTQTFSAIDSGVSSYGYIALPNGWYRIWMIAQATYSVNPGVIAYQKSSAGAGAMWGMQMEVGTALNTYIRTTGTSATRLADVATITPAPRSYDILVQDRNGGAFTNGVAVSGAYTLAPRSGQSRIARVRLYAAGALSAGQKTALAVAYDGSF